MIPETLVIKSIVTMSGFDTTANWIRRLNLIGDSGLGREQVIHNPVIGAVRSLHHHRLLAVEMIPQKVTNQKELSEVVRHVRHVNRERNAEDSLAITVEPFRMRQP